MRRLGIASSYLFLAFCVLVAAAARFYMPIAIPLWAGLAAVAAVGLGAGGAAPRALSGPLAWPALVFGVWAGYGFLLASGFDPQGRLPDLLYPLAATAGVGAGLATWRWRPSRRGWLAAPVAACVLVVAGLILVPGRLAHRSAPAPFRAPAFTLPLLGGGTLDSSSFDGKTVVLAFWASWCGPCREELPRLQRLSRAAAGRGAAFYLVDVGGAGETEAKARAFLVRHGIGIASAYDLDGRLAMKFGTQGALPARLVIGPHGFVRYVDLGYVPGPAAFAGLRRAIAASLRAAAQ